MTGNASDKLVRAAPSWLTLSGGPSGGKVLGTPRGEGGGDERDDQTSDDSAHADAPSTIRLTFARSGRKPSRP